MELEASLKTISLNSFQSSEDISRPVIVSISHFWSILKSLRAQRKQIAADNDSKREGLSKNKALINKAFNKALTRTRDGAKLKIKTATSRLLHNRFYRTPVLAKMDFTWVT